MCIPSKTPKRMIWHRWNGKDGLRSVGCKLAGGQMGRQAGGQQLHGGEKSQDRRSGAYIITVEKKIDFTDIPPPYPLSLPL